MSSSATIADQMLTLQHKGNLTTGVKEIVRMPFAGKISAVTAAVTTAPTGSTATNFLPLLLRRMRRST